MRKSNASVTENNPPDNDNISAAKSGDEHEPADIPQNALDFNPAILEVGRNGTLPAPDPFDPATLRLSQDTAAGLGIKKALLTVPVRKPDKSWFVRVHPDPAYHLETFVVELKEDREVYLVARPLWLALGAEATFSPRALFTAINRQGVLFLWPIRLPGADGKVDEWSRTALQAADMATKGWVRVFANMALGAYEVWEANGQIADPQWSDLPMLELLRIAFKHRLIDTLDHPVLRRLRGEV
jgi:hypothetical protein